MIISKVNNINFGVKFSPVAEKFFQEKINERTADRMDFEKAVEQIRLLPSKDERDILDIGKSGEDKFILLKIHNNSNASFLHLLYLSPNDNLSLTALKNIKENIIDYISFRN